MLLRSALSSASTPARLRPWPGAEDARPAKEQRRKSSSHLLGTLAFVVLVAVCGPHARADEEDHERARRALEAGEIMSLPQILKILERDHPGQVMAVELEREDGRWIYEIKVLRRGGRMLEFEVDAANARVLKVKGAED